MSETARRRRTDDQRPRSAAAIRSARRFRLPAWARPLGVALHLELDPDAGERFRGHVRMEIALDRGTRTLTLHAADLGAIQARAYAAPSTSSPRPIGQRAEVEVDPLREVIRLRFERPWPRGRVHVEIEYEGGVRSDLEGLYRVDCNERRFLFSQLCTTRARTVLPCFDEPGFKASYEISVSTPRGNEVVSNMPVLDRTVDAAGRLTFAFERTPPLPTYLLAVAVGALERSRSVRAGATEIAVLATPGKGALAELALDVARRALPVLEAWFGRALPYPKLDLVAVPDFSFGAMENAGAVFFRETLLLADPDALSFAERKRLTETICHELAHMWFGNLVTMAWWDDLWLNESFATWMAFHVVGEIEPDWPVWQTFQHRKEAALDLDALAHTHPVYCVVRSAEEANENFDLITYEKGASVIRMLAGFLGHETFRAGVRRYIDAHADGNARADDLWRALEAVCDQPVAEIMRAWIERAGHPRISIARATVGGEEVITLEQRLHQTVPASRRTKGRTQGRTRAGADAGPTRATEQGQPRDTTWPVPFIAHAGGATPGDDREIRLILEASRTTLPADGIAWFYGNGGEAGFYRPAHDAQTLAALRAALPRLAPVERQGLVGHLAALVSAAIAPIGSLLEFVESLGDERSPDVLEAVSVPLSALARGLVHDLGGHATTRFRHFVERTFGASLDAVGSSPRPGDDAATRRRRAELVALVGLVAERSDLIEEAATWAPKILHGEQAPDPELLSTWLILAARHGDATLHASCLAALSSATTPQARQRALFALTEFSHADLADRTLERCAQGFIASQDLVFVLGRCLAHPAIQTRAWSFIRSHWDALGAQLPPMHVSRLIAATPALRAEAHRREVRRFFGALDLPSTKRALEQADERFEAHARLKAHAGAELDAWLAR